MMDIDLETARALIDAQFPQYRALELRPVLSGGTDNSIFRLGDTLSARFPKRAEAVGQVAFEHEWLPRLAPLPIRIPKPLAKGAPGSGYFSAWSIYDWCPGAPLSEAGDVDWTQVATALAEVIRALQAKDASQGPLAGPHNHFRGVALVERGPMTRAAVQGLADEYAVSELIHHWEEACAAPPHSNEPVWLHGDLQGGNILVADGEISAIIDFGLCGVGDPACDLMVAWSVLPSEVRDVFRQAVDCDGAMWRRGRGWALSVAVIALEYYRGRNLALSKISRQTLAAVLAES